MMPVAAADSTAQSGSAPRSLDNKVVIVAGAAGAQGSAASALLARAGARVALADLVQDALTDLGAEIEGEGGAAFACSTDIADEASWQALVQQTVERFGRVDGLANFAAILSRPGVEETAPEAWEHTLRVNLTGAWLGMRAVIPAMRAGGGGSIVNIGSVDALVGRGGGAAYQASKGGLRLLGKSAATQYAAENIRVNTVHPGPMRDRMLQVVGPQADPAAVADLEARLTAQVPAGRLGQPSDIAHAVRFLLSDEAAFITGVDLPVDGGLTAQ